MKYIAFHLRPECVQSVNGEENWRVLLTRDEELVGFIDVCIPTTETEVSRITTEGIKSLPLSKGIEQLYNSYMQGQIPECFDKTIEYPDILPDPINVAISHIQC